MSGMNRKKQVIDAAGKSPGRIATEAARLLQGKHKVSFESHRDHGDKVVISNIGELKFTGKKVDQKVYRHHSMHPGGLKETPAKKVIAENPEKVIYHAVAKMLPKNKLRTNRLKRLTFVK